MGKITIRELRNQGRQVVDRVQAGESLIVTRNGRNVAELRPLPKTPLDAATLLQRWRHLPGVDDRALRDDLDRLLDPSL